jgi:hypothetical protein
MLGGGIAPTDMRLNSHRTSVRKSFIAFHHDPGHDDETLDRLRENAVRATRPNFVVSGGCEGAILDIRDGAA